MHDFGQSAVNTMTLSYLEALIAFEQVGCEDWSEVSVEDVDPVTFDLVADDCRDFLGRAAAVTGLVHLDALLKAVDATDLGWYFFMTRADTGVSFDRPQYAAIGTDLDELAAEFGDVRYFLKAGRVHRDVPRTVRNIEPTQMAF